MAAMADDTTTESTERVDEETTEQAKPEIPAEVKRALNKANKEAEALRLKLKEFEDRDKTELQKLADAHQTAEQRASSAEAALVRYKVATAKQLPPELVDRLRGATEDELAEDADRLLSLLGPGRAAPSFDGGARTTASGPPDMNKLLRQAAGRQ